MRTFHLFNVGSAPKDSKGLLDWAARVAASAGLMFSNLTYILSGNLGFGDGVDVDNIRGMWHTYTTNSTPDTEDAIAHNLGVVPVGVLEMKKPASGYLYRGSSAWTTTNIYMKCTAASQSVTLFILLPSQNV